MSSLMRYFAPRGKVIASAITPRVFTLNGQILPITYNNGILGIGSNLTFDNIDGGFVNQTVISSTKQGQQSNITGLSRLFLNVVGKFQYGNINYINNPIVKQTGVAQQVQFSTISNTSITTDVTNGTSFYSDGYLVTYILTQPVVIQFTNPTGGIETVEVLNILNNSECCDGTQTGVYGTYVSNMLFSQQPQIDSNGNAWLVGVANNGSLPVQLFDKNQKLVQTITPLISETGFFRTKIICYISSDGVSNLWMSQIDLTQGYTFGLTAAMQIFSVLDSNNNFILTIQVSYLSPQPVIPYIVNFYDKNKVNYRTITTSQPLTGFFTIYAKFNSSGIWNGANDPNMWAVWTECPNSQDLFFNMILDKKDNIVVTSRMQTGTAVAYDQNNTIIRTITVDTNRSLLVTKIASNGLYAGAGDVNCWAGYINSVSAFDSSIGTNVQTYDGLAINSFNQVILTGRYVATTGAAFAKDAQIGANFPSAGTTSESNTYIVRFAENGTAAGSWRRIINASTDGYNEGNNLVEIDSNDRIIIVGRSQIQTGTPGSTVQILDSADAPLYTYVQTTAQSLYIVPYLNDGTPQGVAQLRGTSIWDQSNIPVGPISIDENYTSVLIDSNDNILIKGIYQDGTLGLWVPTSSAPPGAYTNVRTLINTGNKTDIFVCKVTPDLLSGQLARIGYVSGSQSNTYPAFWSLDSNNNIIMTGYYYDNSLGFFKDGNDIVPIVQIPGSAIVSGVSWPYTFIVKISSNLKKFIVSRLYVPAITIDVKTIPQLFKIDNDNNIICLGVYNTNNDPSNALQIFNMGNYSNIPDVILTNSGFNDIFISKISLMGPSSWISKISGILDQIENNIDLLSQVSAINVDSDNNIYFSGASLGQGIFYNSEGKPVFFTGPSSNNTIKTFFAKYPANGI